MAPRIVVWIQYIHFSFLDANFSSKNKSGQIEVIKGSHTWGHIPHNNREPISLPKKYEIQSINLNEGDVLLFHSLLLHRSKKIVSERFDARLALITHIRNFKHINNSFDLNKSWRIFNMSELTKVEKNLVIIISHPTE